MSKKYTYEYVYNYFKEQGCELLEKEYKNCMTKMKYRCSCKEISYINFNGFKTGYRCAKCGHVRTGKKLTLIYEDVKQYFEDHGCELLEKEYKNCMTKMKYRCSCKRISYIIFNNFKKGQRCKECGRKKYNKKRAFPYEEVKKYFKEHGCELLETEYKNSNTLMKYRCNCKRISYITFYCFKYGQRCKECGIRKSSEKKSFDYEYVYDYFKERGCELLEKEYKDNKAPMKYRCSCKRISYIAFSCFKSGQRCRECGIKKRKGKNNCNWIEDREELKERNKFKYKCRMTLKYVLKKIGKEKNDKTCKMLGYNYKELRGHICAHSNWEKVKDGDYHLDHYFPIKAFLDYGIRDIRLINCLENLQPLTKKDNLEKGAKYDEKEFEEWLIGKGYEIICE